MAALAAAALVLTPAAAWADAGSTIPVGTIEQLRDALDPAFCPPGALEIAVVGDIFAPDESVATTCDTVLDLNGRDVALSSITIKPGQALTVRDTALSVERGTLTAFERDVNRAAIGTTGATFVVESGIVEAETNLHGAAIGGSRYRDGGSVVIAGGWVTARANVAHRNRGCSAGWRIGVEVFQDGSSYAAHPKDLDVAQRYLRRT